MSNSWGAGKPLLFQPYWFGLTTLTQDVRHLSLKLMQSQFSPHISPLYQTQEGQWRALSDGSPIFPGAAFSYISRSFRQTTPYIIGALQLLASSYPPNELNSKGWSLYVEFRPQADGWGKRSEVKCGRVLDLRRKETIVLAPGSGSVGESAFQDAQLVIKVEAPFNNQLATEEESGEPRTKRERIMAEEEAVAVLGNGTTSDDVDLNISIVNKADV